MSHKERNLQRRAEWEANQRYAQTHSEAEVKRHIRARRYPSGRWSHGGANRSSNIKREINRKTIAVRLCLICGGVSQEIHYLSEFFSLCQCGEFRIE